jgi:hypothetical protein
VTSSITFRRGSNPPVNTTPCGAHGVFARVTRGRGEQDLLAVARRDDEAVVLDVVERVLEAHRDDDDVADARFEGLFVAGDHRRVEHADDVGEPRRREDAELGERAEERDVVLLEPTADLIAEVGVVPRVDAVDEHTPRGSRPARRGGSSRRGCAR